jgi:hypothetical protein
MVLFGGIDDSTATVRLQKAFADEKLKWRPWHLPSAFKSDLVNW